MSKAPFCNPYTSIYFFQSYEIKCPLQKSYQGAQQIYDTLSVDLFGVLPSKLAQGEVGV